jgi:hypothetical protein
MAILCPRARTKTLMLDPPRKTFPSTGEWIAFSEWKNDCLAVERGRSLAGADVTMLCSILLRCGIEQIRVIERQMEEWMEKHGYNSVAELQGSMSHKIWNCSDPEAFERAQYIRGLSTSRQRMTDV